MELYYFMIKMYFCASIAVRKVFDPTGAGDTLQEDLQVLLRENVSFENMKNAIIYSSNLASFCREIWN
jgi:bifunctional ADP-heptose synthase (sugar kinase/adenylyltransferase)